MNKQKSEFQSKNIFLKKTFWQKFKNFWKAIGRFIWRHKIITSILVLIFIIFFWITRIILGPFAFLADDLPSLVGFFGEKTYLVLLQNENELRPTGGFITSFAVIKVSFGGKEVVVYDSISVEPPTEIVTAPEPIEKIFSQDEKYRGWVFHDSGFSPDFVENAKQAELFLRNDPRFFGTEFDAIFAVDIHTIAQLIDLFGPFEIDGKVLNSENFFQTLQKNSKDFDLHNEEEWQNRKNFFGPLADQLVAKIFSTPSRWDNLFELLAQMGNEKHFLVFFHDKSLQKDFTEHGWTGALPEQDFFSINIANIGGRKADRFMKRNYWSSFYLDEDGNLTEQLTIRIAHEGTYNLQSDHYQAYLRILRPKGAKISASSGDFETAITKEDLENRTEFGHFFELEPGESKIFTYEFNLPHKINFDQQFDFIFVKQPGVLSEQYSLVFRGANDTSFDAYGCDNLRDTENVLTCDFALPIDRKISVFRRPDRFSPILQWAEFNDDTHLELRFSEKIAPSLASSVIRVIDLDKENRVNEQIKVENVEIKDLAVILTLSGITNQKGEYYQVIIPDLHDVSGNYSDRNPFKATVVR